MSAPKTPVRPPKSWVQLRAFAAVLLVLASVGCGSRDQQETDPAPTGPSGTHSSALPSTPMGTRKTSAPEPSPDAGPKVEPGPDGTLPARRPLTASGKVTRDPDGGCLLLVAGQTRYELRGPAGRLPDPGTGVTVIGTVDRTLASRCGGIPLLVGSVR